MQELGDEVPNHFEGKENDLNGLPEKLLEENYLTQLYGNTTTITKRWEWNEKLMYTNSIIKIWYNPRIYVL